MQYDKNSEKSAYVCLLNRDRQAGWAECMLTCCCIHRDEVLDAFGFERRAWLMAIEYKPKVIGC
jgi:hypothetical protein